MRLVAAALVLAACHNDDGRVAELRQRLSVLEARVAALDRPPPAEWDDGCLKSVADAVATARLFRTLEELVLGEAVPSAQAKADRYACVSDLTRRNVPAVAAAQDAAKAGAGEAPTAAAPRPAPSEHLWDPRWRERKDDAHGCWDETHKRWETDPVHRPQDGRVQCETWCRANPCTYKPTGGGTPRHAREPALMAKAREAGVELGGALTCLVTDVRLLGRTDGFSLSCRRLGVRPLHVRLPAAAGDNGGPLTTVNLGDLVRIGSYGRIAAPRDGGPWTVSEAPANAVSIAERSACCADPSSLAPPAK